MATFTRAILSVSTDGAAINISGSVAAQLILVHTGPTVTTTIHEVFLYAENCDDVSNTAIQFAVGFGGSSTGDFVYHWLTPQAGLELIIPGLPIQGNATPLTVKCYASKADMIKVRGYVNVIA
jgi:hypothetical protein